MTSHTVPGLLIGGIAILLGYSLILFPQSTFLAITEEDEIVEQLGAFSFSSVPVARVKQGTSFPKP